MFVKAAAILLGSISLAIGVNFFLVPFKILDGGMIGVALILKYLWGLNAGAMVILLSIPFYVLAWFVYRGIFFSSLHGMLVSSFFIDLFHPDNYSYLSFFQVSPFIGAIIGGFLVGIGIGLMLMYEASTGGTDLLAQVLAQLIPVNVGILIFVIDGLIILLGGFFLSSKTFYLSMVTIVVVGILTSICVHGQRWKSGV